MTQVTPTLPSNSFPTEHLHWIIVADVSLWQIALVITTVTIPRLDSVWIKLLPSLLCGTLCLPSLLSSSPLSSDCSRNETLCQSVTESLLLRFSPGSESILSPIIFFRWHPPQAPQTVRCTLSHEDKSNLPHSVCLQTSHLKTTFGNSWLDPPGGGSFD